MSKPRSGTLLTNPDANASAVASTTISLEYASLKYQNHCPLGMYIVPSKESLFAWDAVFFVHQGYYADAIFKFRLLFPHEYPDRPPVVQFLTDMFHPLISNKGILNLQPRFHPWRPKEHHIFDVLHFIKSAFKKSVLDKILEVDCMNKESHRYHEAIGTFASLATQSAQLSQSPSALHGKERGFAFTVKHYNSAGIHETRTALGLSRWDGEDDDD